MYLKDPSKQRMKQEFKFGSLDDTLTVYTAHTGQMADPAGKRIWESRVHERASNQALELDTEVCGFVVVRSTLVRHEQRSI